MLVGNDVSKWQGTINYEVYKNNTNFVIAKCTEGTGYKDPQYDRNKSECLRLGIPFGSYHFARPDLGNTPEAEADFYLSRVGGLIEGELLTLDYEPNWNGDAVTWCLNFLRRVESRTGVKPLIYLNQSQVKSYNWQPVVDNGNGLWLACYTYDPNNNNCTLGAWKFMAIQQWTNKQRVPGIEADVDGCAFFGDSGALKKYGYQAMPVPSPAPIPPVTPPTSPAPTPPTTPIPPVPPVTPPVNPCEGMIDENECELRLKNNDVNWQVKFNQAAETWQKQKDEVAQVYLLEKQGYDTQIAELTATVKKYEDGIPEPQTWHEKITSRKFLAYLAALTPPLFSMIQGSLDVRSGVIAIIVLSFGYMGINVADTFAYSSTVRSETNRIKVQSEIDQIGKLPPTP